MTRQRTSPKPSVLLFHHTSFHAWNAIVRTRVLYGSRVAFTEALSECGTLVSHHYTREPYIYLTSLRRDRLAALLPELLISPRVALIYAEGCSLPIGMLKDPTKSTLRKLRKRLPSDTRISVTGAHLKRYSCTIALRIPLCYIDDGPLPGLLPIRRIPAARLLLPHPIRLDRSAHTARFVLSRDHFIGLHLARHTFTSNWEELGDLPAAWARPVAAFRDNLLSKCGPALTSLVLAAVVCAEEMGFLWRFRPAHDVRDAVLYLAGNVILQLRASGDILIPLHALTRPQRTAAVQHVRALGGRVDGKAAALQIGRNVTVLRQLTALLESIRAATLGVRLFPTHWNA